jgi:stage V sporulation protein SpoVS
VEDHFRAATASNTRLLAGAIAKSIRADHQVVLQAIGAGAVTRAALAIDMARDYLEQDNLDIGNIPDFIEVEFNERIAVRLRVDQIERPFPLATPIPRKPQPPKGAV